MAVEVTFPTPRCLKDTSNVLDIVAQTLDVIDRFNHTTIAVPDAKADPLSDVEDCLKGLDELFLDGDEEIQSEIISTILSARPCSLQTHRWLQARAYQGYARVDLAAMRKKMA